MEAGTARTHLENCTGKILEKQLRSGRFQSEAKRLWNSQIRLSLHLNSLRNEVAVEARSSEKERRVDAKALIADEGRDKLRKVRGSCK